MHREVLQLDRDSTILLNEVKNHLESARKLETNTMMDANERLGELHLAKVKQDVKKGEAFQE